MILFDPPEIFNKLKNAKIDLEDYLEWDWHEIDSDDFNPGPPSEEELGDEVINLETEIEVGLAHSLEPHTFTVQELIELHKAYETATLHNSSIAISKHLSIIRVKPHSSTADALANGYPLDLSELSVAQTINNAENEFQVSLINNPNLFNVLIERDFGAFDKYNHSYYVSDTYICIEHEKPAELEAIKLVTMSFLFILASSYNLVFAIDDFEIFDIGLAYSEALDEGTLAEQDSGEKAIRLRPADTSFGMVQLYELYMQGSSSYQIEYKIISYTKILEYCSESWLRLRTHNEISNLLCLPAALNPDFDFIARLIRVMNSQKEYRKQGNATQMLIRECCTAVELSTTTPAYLQLFRNISEKSNGKDLGKALDSLASCIVATRNQLVHAKPSYEPTGDECPESDLKEFAECLELVALQAINWFSNLPTQFRVVK